jgi:bifunctional UDP-N-acetylglucosamine pyrophosphorylase/glucosamine-1-phosphate N-acetyltransferase
MSDELIVIPAAGLGSRMHSSVPKPFIQFTEEKRIIDVVLQNLRPLKSQIVVVLSPHSIGLWNQTDIHSDVRLVVQQDPIGMVDAVFCARDLIEGARRVIVVWSDQIGLSRQTVERARSLFDYDESAKCVIPMYHAKDPYVEYEFGGDGLTNVRQTRLGETTNQNGLTDVGCFLFQDGRSLLGSWKKFGQIEGPFCVNREANMLPFLKFLSTQDKWKIEKSPCLGQFDSVSINTEDQLNYAKSLLGRYV